MQKLHQQHLNPRTKYRKPSPTTREDWRLAKEIQKVRQQQLNPEKNTQELHQQQLSPETKYRKPSPTTRENWRSPKLPSTLEQLEPWLRTAQLSQQDSSSTWGKEQVKMQLSISFSRRRLCTNDFSEIHHSIAWYDIFRAQQSQRHLPARNQPWR